MKLENKFIKAIHDKLDPKVYHEKMTPVFSSGTPDCFYEGDKADLWVEYKALKELPKRDSTIIDVSGMLSPLQVEWLNRRCRSMVHDCRTKDQRNVSLIIVGLKVGSRWGGNIYYYNKEDIEIKVSAKEFSNFLCTADDITKVIKSWTCHV